MPSCQSDVPVRAVMVRLPCTRSGARINQEKVWDTASGNMPLGPWKSKTFFRDSGKRE